MCLYQIISLGYRVPWTVIHYWEKRFDRKLIEYIVKHIGNILDDKVRYEYSVIDSTKFSLWNMDVIEFHILSRKNRDTLYPVSIGFGSDFKTHLRILVDGKGFLFADRWYEYEEFIREVYRHGYKPVIKPNIWRDIGGIRLEENMMNYIRSVVWEKDYSVHYQTGLETGLKQC